MSTTVTYVVNNISLPVHASVEEAFSVAKKRLASVGVNSDLNNLAVYRRSIDARRKNEIKFVYSISCIASPAKVDATILARYGIGIIAYETPTFEFGEISPIHPIVVVGSGPAGLFASLLLAEAGFSVLLLEKGGTVEERKRAVEHFKTTRVLDTSCNIQFGAGGAGTFSDGKLVTRINDAMSSYVLDRFIEFGAPSEIKYLAKPHVGTDILSGMVDKMLSRIQSLGGTVMYHTEFLDYKSQNGHVTEVITSNGVFPCSALLLAVGHSARNTYFKLFEHDVIIEAKPFSVGLRIEHTKETIDKGLYGDLAGDPVLSSGEYNLSYNTKERGVYTFCMCPGGEVVAATSEEGGVVVNGMSSHARNGRNSNSAICCSIFREDYGATPEAAIKFQRDIERRAFHAGGGDYSAPIITVGDFLRGECRNMPSDVIPTYFDGKGVKLAAPETYLPQFVCNKLRLAICDFDNKIPSFATPSAVLTGVETRTSAPIRIMRDNSTNLAKGYDNFYPCGEGAGYAGGITSAAIDGIRCAMSIMRRFKP